MRTKAVVAGAVLLVILILASIVFITVRPSAVPLTIRHVKSVQSDLGVEMTFEITNYTASDYIYSVRVEVRNGPVWNEPFQVGPAWQEVGPHRLRSSTLVMESFPRGSPLRARLSAIKKNTGLGTFLTRLDLRFLKGQKNVALNPFDKRIFYSKPTLILSEEFVVPEPEATSKVNSAK